jgi:hypothetical protein
MAKTAMQEAVERIKTRIKDLEEESLTPIGESRVQGYKIVLSELMSLIEKEKQQIIDAWDDGANNLMSTAENGDDYYTQTFKQ